MQTKIFTSNLTAGMYVSGLDRPWVGTPFWLQGFQIENDEQLMQLRQYCKFVMVDPALSSPNVLATISACRENPGSGKPDSANLTDESLIDDDSGFLVQPDFVPENIKLTKFRNIVPIDAELAPADEAYTRTAEALGNLFRDFAKSNHIAIEEVEAVVQIMVASMARNPDALMLISRFRQEDEEAYSHGVSVAIYMVALGRHLGLPIDILERLGVSGLLHDIGSVRLPQSLMKNKNRLTEAEFNIVKNHVSMSLDILRDKSNLHPEILDGIAQHHERENGSGYPAGISKGDISLFGRIAAIADTFSSMTTPRPYAETYPAYQALQTLSNLKKDSYHAPIVEQFIHAIGIFPVGSMVELSTGEVAVVISHNKVRRLKPRVMIISDKDKTPTQSPTTLDLLHPPATYETPPTIVCGLPTGAYGLNPREYYME